MRTIPNKTAVFVCAALALCLLAPVAAADDSGMAAATGKVAKVDAEKGLLVLQTDDEKPVTLEVNDETAIEREGSKVKLADVAAGDRLQVSYKKSEGANLAVTISILQSEA
jgi:hypothetical protein